MNYSHIRKILTPGLLLLAVLSHGQVILSDTLAVNCKEVNRVKGDAFIIASQEEFEDLAFTRSSDKGCMPFTDIDFTTTMLVGCRYQGSNCDESIHWSALFTKGDNYLIQFLPWGPPCRDQSPRIAWFIIEKPIRKVNISFERVFKQGGN